MCFAGTLWEVVRHCYQTLICKYCYRHACALRNEDVLQVGLVTIWDGRHGTLGGEKVNVLELSLDCWQPDSSHGGEVEMTSNSKSEVLPQAQPHGNVKDCVKILSAGEAWPVLFPDLLDLSSTPHGGTVCDDTKDTIEQLKKALKRINELEGEVRAKTARVHELDGKVESMEWLIDTQASNLFIGFESVIVAKDATIARLNTVVSQLKERITTLEDKVDDHEVHVMIQSVIDCGKSPRQRRIIGRKKLMGPEME